MQFDGLLVKLKQCYRFEKKKRSYKGHVVFRDLNHLSDMFLYRIKHVKIPLQIPHWYLVFKKKYKTNFKKLTKLQPFGKFLKI